MSHSDTEILGTQSKGAFDRAVSAAAEVLRKGQLVGLPTETVYGLAGNAWQESAVRSIYEVKGRPATNPLIVHVVGWEMVRECAREWTDLADRLARAFWPGPLTLVLPRSSKVPDVVTAGGDTVAVRWPSHPVMQAVIRECGFPVAAPSANRSNALSPTQAEHVQAQLSGRIPLIVDGGHANVGIESTVVDLVGRPARVLRPGMISLPALQAADPDLKWSEFTVPEGKDSPVRSPGQLRRHYSPEARLLVRRWTHAGELDALVAKLEVARNRIGIVAYGVIPEGRDFARVAVVPHDAEAYARALFSELHLCDAAHCECIVVEAPPEEPEWAGVRDRLQRASAVE